MKKLVILLSLTLFSFACPPNVECFTLVAQEKAKATPQITASYAPVRAQLMAIKSSLNQKLETLKENNKILESKLALEKESLLSSSEIVFLLEKNNQIQANLNDQRAIK